MWILWRQAPYSVFHWLHRIAIWKSIYKAWYSGEGHKICSQDASSESLGSTSTNPLTLDSTFFLRLLRGLGVSICKVLRTVSGISASSLSCLTLCDLMNSSSPGSSVYGDSSGENTGVGCHALLQGIFPTQKSNADLPHCRWILYQLSYRDVPGM